MGGHDFGRAVRASDSTGLQPLRHPVCDRTHTNLTRPDRCLEGVLMNFTRIFLAALGAFVVYFVLGGVMFGLLPTLKSEFMKYPAVYRSQEGIKSTMPFGMFAMFIAMLVLTILYAMLYHGRSGLAEGARFGALIGVFAICSFVIHNYVNLNIGLKLTVQQSVAYFVEWLAVGIVIGLIYQPSVSH